MRNLPVFWHEGMFLRPQHFQAAERYWTELVESSEQLDHPYYYGLRSLSLGKEAIANNQFQINSCQARMRDGTVIDLAIGQEPDRLDMRDAFSGQVLDSVPLTEAFEKQSRVRVFLAVPRLKIGRKNVGLRNDETDCRFLIAATTVQDETDGGNDQEIEFRTVNVRLLLSTQTHTGFEVLPIAQIKRTGDASAAPELDAEYIPPLIAIEAWPQLSRDIIRVIYDRLGEHINVLSEQLSDLDSALTSNDPLDMKRVLILSRLNEIYAGLGSLTFSAGIHPFQAYAELCRAVGQLSTFGPVRRSPELPRYDHDNLQPVFKWLKDQIDQLLQSILPQDTVMRRYFTGLKGGGMQVTFEPQWLAEGWNWYIGVNRGTLADADCRELLKPGAENLDWKFGSASMVDFYKRMFHRGLQLEEVFQVPRHLPARGWLFYAVRRDNEAWPHVQREQTLAMRLNTQKIRNLDTLEGKRDLVVSSKGQNVVLQFALFAVPPIR